MPPDHVPFDHCELSPELSVQGVHFDLGDHVDGLIELLLVGAKVRLRHDKRDYDVRAVLCLEGLECFADCFMARPIRLPDKKVSYRISNIGIELGVCTF